MRWEPDLVFFSFCFRQFIFSGLVVQGNQNNRYIQVLNSLFQQFQNKLYWHFHNIKFSSSYNKQLPTPKLMLDLQTTVPFYPTTLSLPGHGGPTLSCSHWCVLHMRNCRDPDLNSCSEPDKGWWLLSGMLFECWELASQSLQQDWKPCSVPSAQANSALAQRGT